MDRVVGNCEKSNLAISYGLQAVSLECVPVCTKYNSDSNVDERRCATTIEVPVVSVKSGHNLHALFPNTKDYKEIRETHDVIQFTLTSHENYKTIPFFRKP